MNTLTFEIVKHIFENLGILNQKLNLEQFKSLNSKEFLLDKSLSLVSDEGEVKSKVWGCQQSFGSQLMTMLLADLSIQNDKAYALIVQLKDSPAYALYFNLDETFFDETVISCTIDNKDWIICNTHLQATFLAAMEQIKEVGLSWRKAEDYNEQYDLMVSFIKYYDSLFGDIDEGQEN